MSGRTLLAFGILLVGTLAAAPASACGSDDRFPCGQTSQSSDAKSDQTTSASKSQRTTKVRGQRKRLAAKKTTRNAARARIVQTSRSTTSRTASAKRVDERPRVETTARVESSAKVETVKRIELSPAVETDSRGEKNLTETPAPRYEIASAESAPLVSMPALPSSDLLSPVPTAGATEIIRFATPSGPAEIEQLSNAAPIVAASEAPTVEFKSDPARLFTTPAVVSERVIPRKNSPSGLSWMQAVLLALGGGIVAVSTFKLFSASNTPA